MANGIDDGMGTVVVATRNEGKIAEIAEILGSVQGLAEMSFVTIGSLGTFPDPVEDGETFFDNALIKARAALDATGMGAALAEDSGLVVDALGGEPGVLSARWSGDHDEVANNERLLGELAGIPEGKRTARYHACAVLVIRDGEGEHVLRGEGDCEGSIAEEPRGTGGFAYDPLFVPSGFLGRHMAELSPGEKNAISHRRRALENLGRKVVVLSQ